MRRAALAAEFSLAKYLMSGINASDNEVVAEAQAMLDELASDVEATGGQDIGQKFWEPEPTPEPSAQTTAPVAPAETESAIVTDNDIELPEDESGAEQDSAPEPEAAPSGVAEVAEPEPDTQPFPTSAPVSGDSEESTRDETEQPTKTTEHSTNLRKRNSTNCRNRNDPRPRMTAQYWSSIHYRMRMKSSLTM